MPYTLNGQQLNVSEEPHERDGVIYVPWRQVVEALGGTVDWDSSTGQIAGRIGQWRATFAPGSSTADVSGTTVQFPAPSYEKDGEQYVPANFFNSAFGYKVEADGANVNLTV